MHQETTTIEAFWKVLSAPTGDENLKREIKVKTPNFFLPRFEFPKLRFPRVAA